MLEGGSPGSHFLASGQAGLKRNAGRLAIKFYPHVSMSKLKSLAKRCVRALGYEVWRVHKDTMGLNPISDFERLILNGKQPLIFDVGANFCQSIEGFKER